MGLFERVSQNHVLAEALGARDALEAFVRSAQRLIDGQFPMGTLGLDPSAFVGVAHDALDLKSPSEETARAFFSERFVALSLKPGKGRRGFVTGYYEPEVEASTIRTPRFRFPLYGKPKDLEKVDDVSRPPGLDKSFLFAQRRSSGILGEYPDRAAIEAGALEGQGLEIAWLNDEVDAFFIHIQGSARLRMSDGTMRRVGYAAKSGHPFTAIGRVLVETGELTLDEADMAGIRKWLADHPDRRRALFDRNRSFIFFALSEGSSEALGPVGAAKVPLTPLTSIAVDRTLATYGLPYVLKVPGLEIDGVPFHRVCVSQDTGSAILGAARADIFVGSGVTAGAVAGRIRHDADFTVLVPRELAASLVP